MRVDRNRVQIAVLAPLQVMSTSVGSFFTVARVVMQLLHDFLRCRETPMMDSNGTIPNNDDSGQNLHESGCIRVASLAILRSTKV